MPLEENLRIRISTDLKERWTAACERKKISQQDAINEMMEWFLGQEDLVQSMIFGQIESTPELHRLVLNKLMERSQKTGKK